MRNALPRAYAAFSWLVSLGLLGAVAALAGFLVARGAGTLGPGLLFGNAPVGAALLGQSPVVHGLWPAVAGTLALVFGSSLLAIPLGGACGVYLAECGSGRWCRTFSSLVDVLAAVPSVLMGLFGFVLILFLRRTLLPGARPCLLLAMVCLALLVLPYLIRTTETALRSLPDGVRLVGPSLGLSAWQSLWRVQLPAASRGIFSGVVLAVGRAAEDTAVILLAGVVASGGTPAGLTDSFQAIPFTIYWLAAEHRNPAELDLAFGAALLLFCLTGLLFLLAWRLQRGLEKRWAIRP